jgi:hypothetical protein
VGADGGWQAWVTCKLACLPEIRRTKIFDRKLARSPQNANRSNRTRDINAMALVQTNPDAYVIKPEAAAPAIDTSDWPLLLKNYSDCTKLFSIASR